MSNIKHLRSIDDISILRESGDVECKLAQGRDGTGTLPKDVWETYSAFANTRGGNIFLGLRELKDESYELAGITNTEKVLNEIYSGLSDPEKISHNILHEHSIQILEIQNKYIIHIYVPEAEFSNKPIFIENNLLKGSYKRINSSDILHTEHDIKVMLAIAKDTPVF